MTLASGCKHNEPLWCHGGRTGEEPDTLENPGKPRSSLFSPAHTRAESQHTSRTYGVGGGDVVTYRILTDAVVLF